MALSFIGREAASAVIGNLVNTGLSYLNAFPAASRMQDELDRLQNALPQVQAVLTAVEECTLAMVQNNGMNKWLLQFEDAVENAKNVVTELENRIQDRDDRLRGNIISKCKVKIDSFIIYIFGDDTMERLRRAVKMLNNAIDSMGPFLQIATGFYRPNVQGLFVST